MQLDAVRYTTPAEIALGQQHESVLQENADRWVMFPIRYNVLWAMYKEIENNFWAAENFRFANDSEGIAGLDPELRQCMVKLLSYHNKLDHSEAARPAAVTLDLLADTQLPEARAFYGFQVSYENIHSEVFGSMSIAMPGSCEVAEGNEKIGWLSGKFASAECFYQKVVLQCISKSVFRCAFGVINAFLRKEGLLPTFVSAMEAVDTDVGIHLKFAAAVLEHLKLRLSRDVLLPLLSEAAELELAFCRSVLPLALMGVSEDVLSQYVKSSVNQCLLVAGQAEAHRLDAEFGWLRPMTVSVTVSAAQVQQSKPKVIPAVEATIGEISFDEDF